jgi:hypothetical protein
MAEARKQQELAQEQAKAEQAAREAAGEADAQRAQEQAREIEAQRKLSEARTMDEMDQIQHERNQAAAALPVVVSQQVKGQQVKEDWDWEVTNIWDFARENPGAVKIEVRPRELKAILDKLGKAEGIRAWKTTTSNVRVGRAA